MSSNHGAEVKNLKLDTRLLHTQKWSTIVAYNGHDC